MLFLNELFLFLPAQQHAWKRVKKCVARQMILLLFLLPNKKICKLPKPFILSMAFILFKAFIVKAFTLVPAAIPKVNC